MAETIALNLARLRAERGLTQRQLAEAAGLSWSQISRYESGAVMPRLGSLVRLADALGVAVEDLERQSEGVDMVFDVEFDNLGNVRCTLQLSSDQYSSLVTRMGSTDEAGQNKLLRGYVEEALLHAALSDEGFMSAVRQSKRITSIKVAAKASSSDKVDDANGCKK